MSSKTHIENNIICTALQAATNSPLAMLTDTLPFILLLWPIGALFRNTCRPPHHLQKLSSVTSPELEILLIWNSYSLPPSQIPSGCITNPMLGMHSMCCMTHSMPFVQFGYASVMKSMSSQILFMISSHNHFTKYLNFPMPLQYLG